jgi:hypothetical protein
MILINKLLKLKKDKISIKSIIKKINALLKNLFKIELLIY